MAQTTSAKLRPRATPPSQDVEGVGAFTQQEIPPGITQAPSVPKVLNGFPRTSQFIAADPDKTTVVFWRFDNVSVRNLLYLEGRVAALEKVLNSLDREGYWDHLDKPDLILATQSWEEFALLGSLPNKIPQAARDMWKKARLGRKEQQAKKDRENQPVPPPDEFLRTLRQGIEPQAASTSQSAAKGSPSSPRHAQSLEVDVEDASPFVMQNIAPTSVAPTLIKIIPPRVVEDSGGLSSICGRTKDEREPLGHRLFPPGKGPEACLPAN